MSRWTDQFENHAIHETLKQAREWAYIEIEDIDSDHEFEQRRIIKFIDTVTDILSGMDTELFPESQLSGLNNHLRHQNFWNQLSSYSSNANVQHLRTANDHISGHIHIVYILAGMSKHPDSRNAIKGVEMAYEEFCKTIEKTKNSFDETASKKASELSDLETRTDNLSSSLETLTATADSQISTWQNEFTESQTLRAEEHSEAQTNRAEEFSEAQIARSKEYDEALRAFKENSNADRIETTNKHDNEFKKLFETYSENVNTKTIDINDKHKSILKIHGLVTNDGVAGGYKRGADDEKRAALIWSVVSMACYAIILLWVLFKGKLGFGIADLDGIDWPLVVTTVSVTAVAFVAAQFAGKQSRVHRMNEQRMRWFSFEIAAIDPFISSLPIEMQQGLKKELSERLFGQDRVIDDKGSKTQNIDPDMITRVTTPITEAIKAARK